MSVAGERGSCYGLIGTRIVKDQDRSNIVAIVNAESPEAALAKTLEIWPTFRPEHSPIELHPSAIHKGDHPGR